jgi:hypothetical protein
LLKSLNLTPRLNLPNLWVSALIYASNRPLSLHNHLAQAAKMWSLGNYSSDLRSKVSHLCVCHIRATKSNHAIGFIAIETKTTDDLGLFETHSRVVKGKTKAKGKQANHRKNLQKTKYVFNKSSKRTPAYKDYFNPDHTVENRMLGLSNLVGRLKFVCLFTSIFLDSRRPASNLSRRILTHSSSLPRPKPLYQSYLLSLDPKHKRSRNYLFPCSLWLTMSVSIMLSNAKR